MKDTKSNFFPRLAETTRDAKKDRMIMYCHRRLLLATLALAATLAEPAAAQAPQSWTLAGTLDCKVDPNVGFTMPGHQSMRCLFTPTAPIPSEVYAGALNTSEQNAGISSGAVLGFAVLAPTTGLSPGALAGEYVGASGDAGIGVGAGPNVLLGGSKPHRSASAEFASGFDHTERCSRFVVA